MKHVTWNDIVKLGTMNPIVQKNLDELGELPGITHAYALMAMVDELDGQLERDKRDSMYYRYLRDPISWPRELDVLDTHLAMVDGDDLDRRIHAELVKQGLPCGIDGPAVSPQAARDQVLATLRGAGFTDTADTLATALDAIDAGKTVGNAEPLPGAVVVRKDAATLAIEQMYRAAHRFAEQNGVDRLEVVFRLPGGPSYVVRLEDMSRHEVAKNDQVSGEKVASDQAEG